MCGRYKVTLCEFSDLKARFNLEEIPLFKLRYNIAPTQQAPVIANLDGANRLDPYAASGLPPCSSMMGPESTQRHEHAGRETEAQTAGG